MGISESSVQTENQMLTSELEGRLKGVKLIQFKECEVAT